MPLSFPQTPRIITSDNLGLTAAVGASFTFTFTEFVQVLYISVFWLSDGVAGTRQPQVTFFSDTGLQIWQMLALSDLPAATLEQAFYPQGPLQKAIGVEVFAVNLAAQLYAFENYTMVFNDRNAISAGDMQFIRFQLQGGL